MTTIKELRNFISGMIDELESTGKTYREISNARIAIRKSEGMYIFVTDCNGKASILELPRISLVHYYLFYGLQLN